ncbi:MAG: Hsp20/alpha crystallin family protein [Bacteroidota bacterium]
MSLVKFAPSTLLGSSSLPVFSNLMENFFGRDLFDLTNQSFGGTLPAVNIRETNDDFMVDVAAPGMKKEDFKVELENNLLTISAEKEQKNGNSNGENYTRQEFRYHSFIRSFGMPNNADADRIQATYHDGVLSIQVPKKEEAKKKAPRTIEIS